MPLPELFSSLGDNQFFKAGFGLVGVGVLAGGLRKGVQYGSIAFRRLCMVSLEVPCTDASYFWLLRWLTLRAARNTQHMSLQTIFEQPDMSVRSVETKYDFIPSTGGHFFWYGRRLIRMERERETNVKLTGLSTPWESITLFALGRDRTVFSDMLNQAREMVKAEVAGKTIIFKAHGHEWKVFGRPKVQRPFESVVLAPGKAERLLADAQDFINSAKWYAERGIPYRRGYLLYGPAGCGKSSFITALAGTLNLNICMLSLGDRSLSNDVLDVLLSTTPPQSIVLMEDIDAAFARREDDDWTKVAYQGHSAVTLSGLLNALDGVASGEGRLIFMTTNYVERLDAALIRPGRVDIKEDITFCDRTQLAGMFRKFYPRESTAMVDAFTDSVLASRQVVSPAQVQGHFMLHKDSAQAAIDNVRTISDFCTREQLQLLFKQFYPNEPGSSSFLFAKYVLTSKQVVSQSQVNNYFEKHKSDPETALQEVASISNF